MPRLARSVSIVGVGYTPMGNVQRHDAIRDFTERELFAMAAIEAMQDAGLEAREIDAFYVGQVASARFTNQMAGSTALADWIGMRNKPSISHDEACATSNIGLHLAVMAVASGVHDIVLTGGTNVNASSFRLGEPPHLRKPDPAVPQAINQLASDPAYFYPGSGVFQPFDAAVVSYGKKYGVSHDDLTDAMNRAAIISRRNALLNPKALWAEESMEEEAQRLGYNDVDSYMRSDHNPVLCGLQRVKHTSPVSDGASVIIVCATDIAKRLHKPPVEVAGFASATAHGNHLVGTPFPFETQAFEQAYGMAGITAPGREVDYMSVHDCSAQHYFTVTEAGGYFEPGEAWQAILDERIAPHGDRPVNTSGGRLNLGHPLAGATGIEIAEAVQQMRGECGERQMAQAPGISVIQAYGGGFISSVSVLRAI